MAWSPHGDIRFTLYSRLFLAAFMKKFETEFNTLQYVIENAKSVLLFAHSRPDADTVGSVLALQKYIRSAGKKADVACPDPFPKFLESFSSEKFLAPQELDLAGYDCVIACDSVERGFEDILPRLDEKQVSIIIDHHPDISLAADVVIIDPTRSSVCEIIYDFFKSIGFSLPQSIATFLMIGILGDTGNFQHANTTARVMEIASDLMKRGASLSKIVDAMFSNKELTTLRLWGRAFEKSIINAKNGMITTVITKKDVAECDATIEDISQVSTILNSVPKTKFALVLSEREPDIIKGSLRSEEYKNVDVSAIAHRLGGGGHKLASGFELRGKIVETADGWRIA